MAIIKDGRVLARENEIRVLRALHRFGWLRTRDLAALVWVDWKKSPVAPPNFSPPVTTSAGLRMAQRTLRRLRANRQVLSGQGPDGSIIYSLAEAGARSLRQIGVPALTGKDLVRKSSISQFRHRCISNEIAIGSIVKGHRVSTEREISQGFWMGGSSGILGKKPDVLIRSTNDVWWIEVERSRKNTKDYVRLLKWLDRVKRDILGQAENQLLGDKLHLKNVVFICTKNFQEKLIRDLSSSGWTEKHFTTIKFETCLYCFEDMIFRT